MSDSKELRRQADECFRRSLDADRFSKPFWLALSQQWASMAEEVEAASSLASRARLDWLKGPLEESLSERALALSAARAAKSRS